MKWNRSSPLFWITLIIVALAGAAFWPHFARQGHKTVWVAPVNEISSTRSEQESAELPPVPAPGTKAETKQEAATGPNAAPVSPAPDAMKPLKERPRIAIVIDDVGPNLAETEKAIRLPPSVTLSFLPYAQHLTETTSRALAAGHELLLHMPMEPLGNDNPGPNALLTNMPPEEIRSRLETALDSFKGLDGVNSHMGSKFTTDREGMNAVLNVLQERHLFFFDSLTNPKSVAGAVAREHHVPTQARDVFLDNNTSVAAVKARLAQTEQVALRKGHAIAIGHPHPNLIKALEEWLPEVEKKGFVIVPLHDLVK